MKLSIVIIGDEILLGQVTDTNSGVIARTFEPEGWEISEITVVGDNAGSILGAIKVALDSSDLVLTTGGLGPTKDDITKKVLQEIFGGELVYNESVAENIREVFRLRGLKLNPLTEAQAMVPSSCRVIQNCLGTAPIMCFERGAKQLIAMPGVPFETEGMLAEVKKYVAEIFQSGDVYRHHTLMVGGITESDLASRLENFEDSLTPDLHLAYLPQPGLIRLRLDGKNIGKGLFLDTLNKLKSELCDNLIYDGDASAAEILLEVLRRHSLTCATAESCTGGNIAHSITAIAGASESFLGSVVSYSNSVKKGLLDVNADTLSRYGAVSREVVEQMAFGACRATDADCAVATSGIAGPGGGSAEKPVGTVWIGWCVKGHLSSRRFQFPGNRARVIDRTTTEAILGLVAKIKDFSNLD